MTPLRVLHAPVIHASNPYQRLLAEGLARHGVTVEEYTGPMRFFSKKSPHIADAGVPLLHLHWLPNAGGTPFKARINSAIFHRDVKAVRKSGKRIVWTAHNIVAHESAAAEQERRSTAKFVRESVDAVIAHGRSAVSEIVEAFGLPDDRKIHVIPHGNYDGCYPPAPDQAEARKRLGLPPGKLVYLFLGAIRRNKGLPDLLDTFGSLPESADAHLVIAGKPSNDADVLAAVERARTTPNVTLHDRFVDGEELSAFFGACDVVVLPYRSGLTSGALLLALTFGKACIAPRLGCIAETIDEHGSVPFDPDTPGDLGRAMHEIVRRRSELTQMGLHNRGLAEPLNWEAIGGKTADVYRSILD